MAEGTSKNVVEDVVEDQSKRLTEELDRETDSYWEKSEEHALRLLVILLLLPVSLSLSSPPE